MSSTSDYRPLLVDGRPSPLGAVNGEVRIPLTTGEIRIPPEATVSLYGDNGVQWYDPEDEVTYIIEECMFVRIHGKPWKEVRNQILRDANRRTYPDVTA